MKRLVCIGFPLLLTACAVSTPLPEQESIAFDAYRKHCGACHALPHPGRHTFEAWRQVVTLMERRMEEKGLAPLSTEERDLILAYLKRHAR